MQPLPLGVKRLWRSIAAAQAVAFAITLAVVDVLLRRRFDPVLPPLVAPATLGLILLALGFLVSGIRYRAWGFELTDDWVRAQWGVLIHRTATIPRNRVQTLTSENGPLDRLLGLTSVTVHTAGAGAPDLAIPHLEDGTVEWLRSELARGPLR